MTKKVTTRIRHDVSLTNKAKGGNGMMHLAS